MVVFALVSPVLMLGFLFVMQGIEQWLIDDPPDALPREPISPVPHGSVTAATYGSHRR